MTYNDFLAPDSKGLGKMKAKKNKWWEKINNWAGWYSYKDYLASLFLGLLKQEFAQYIWTLAAY